MKLKTIRTYSKAVSIDDLIEVVTHLQKENHLMKKQIQTLQRHVFGKNR